MEVGMYQLLVLHTRGARPAGISLELVFRPCVMIPLFVGAVDELRVSNGQGEFPASFGTEKKLGMADPLVDDRPDQFLLDLFLPWNFTETHC